MPKFSVKKPLTVFVAVVAILVLGVVAYLKMTPDLLPNMDFPYIVVMTTYPGASPEKVETEITKPMEQSMSTLEHIKEVTSTSSENYSVVLLQFEESVNMDTIGVDIQQKLAALQGSWDDMVGSPYVLKINPSMLPVEVAAVSMDGKDTAELTQFLSDTLMPKLEGITGVARITASGEVEQKLHVVLDQKKIDEVNGKIAAAMMAQLGGASMQLPQADAAAAGMTQPGADASGIDQAQLAAGMQSAAVDVGSMLTMDMISGILKAQSFYMPAGYVPQDGVSYMVSVGEEITDLETLRSLLLFDLGIPGIDPIRLEDVAEVFLTDNRDETYARLNGQESIVLSFEKQSTYSSWRSSTRGCILWR